MHARLKLLVLSGILISTASLAQTDSTAPAPTIAAPPPLPAAPVSPEDAAKRTAAERYLATQDENANFERLIAMLGASLHNPSITEQQRKDFIAYARDHLDRTMLKNGMIDAMMETYTLPELKALADFYSSPLGTQISAKSAQFQAEAMRATFPVAVTFMQKYAAECTDKSKCIDLSMMAK